MYINLRQRMTPKKNMEKTIFWESSWPRKAAVGRSKKRKAKPRKATPPKRWLLERKDISLEWQTMGTEEVQFFVTRCCRFQNEGPKCSGNTLCSS